LQQNLSFRLKCSCGPTQRLFAASAPLFLLFLQEIISYREAVSAGKILDFKPRDAQGNSG